MDETERPSVVDCVEGSESQRFSTPPRSDSPQGRIQFCFPFIFPIQWNTKGKRTQKVTRSRTLLAFHCACQLGLPRMPARANTFGSIFANCSMVSLLFFHFHVHVHGVCNGITIRANCFLQTHTHNRRVTSRSLAQVNGNLLVH